MVLAAPAISQEKRDLFNLLVPAIKLVNEIFELAKNPHAEEALAVQQPKAMPGDTLMDYIWRGVHAVWDALLPHLREDKKAVAEKATALKRQIAAVRAKVLELPNHETKRELLKLGDDAYGWAKKIYELAAARRSRTVDMDSDMITITLEAEDCHKELTAMREKVLRMP
jgi:hypothetical protein